MLTEIDEAAATGEIAGIFAEVRRLWAVPYVSAIHRHLATRPGVLEWAWEAVGPAFRSGRAQEAGWLAAGSVAAGWQEAGWQEAGWQEAGGVALSPLEPIPAEALAAWDVDGRALATIGYVVDGFVRVAPVNMMFAGLVKALLEGKAAGGSMQEEQEWSPPPVLPPPPSMLAPADLSPVERSVLMRFAAASPVPGGTPFVPGLYRMLAHWPGLLAHLATVLAPRLAALETTAACDRLRARIDAAVPAVLASLPAAATRRAMPDAAERAHFLEVGAVYRKTSPDLVVLGGLIRAALPLEAADQTARPD